MAPEILPPSSDGLETSLTRVTIPNESEMETKTVSGTRAAVIAEERNRIGAAAAEKIASLTYREHLGRGVLDIQYTRIALDTNPIDGDSIQELYGVDIVRDIVTAPYFKELTTKLINPVVAQYEKRDPVIAGWNDLQKSLFGHLVHGQDSWVETRYELRQTWLVASTTALNVAASDANTVVTGPVIEINATLKNLIDSLPEGQWLKKPIQVQQAGKRGWIVTLTYQWAKEWSIIYGGTFTGIDP